MAKNIIIMGAAGRDFHNFNVLYRDNPEYNVVAFTAFQIPGIDGRKYPAKLAGRLYPSGIDIYDESELPKLIKEHKAEEVIFSYSDVNFVDLMKKGSLVTACGADFKILDASRTMIKSSKPVIAVCAVRTGCGKSQTTRKIAELLKKAGKKVVAIRHPMPYGDLVAQTCQRYAEYADLEKHKCTIEEMEEYEPHIREGHVVYSGVDYGVILAEAEKEADVILWDGGNNDTPFYKPDLHIVVADPHRPGHEMLYYPGMTNAIMADVVIINKVDTATRENIDLVRSNISRINPNATIIEADSPCDLETAVDLKGKKVLVVEDGPTLTHGEMEYGAAYIAAKNAGAGEIVSPKQYAVGSILETYKKYGHVSKILPAMGYGKKQIAELEETINKVPCDVVLIGTPIDLGKLLKIEKPATRVFYSYKDRSEPTLKQVVDKVLAR
ncbi:MAG: cyclic 2,3-diphosphoglycerate synthase [Elusimicrobiaceae bacterium]|nr:cyclic 2,3-diphosphoglycerate synthase [Elusimicrobiaceae bacterium]